MDPRKLLACRQADHSATSSSSCGGGRPGPVLSLAAGGITQGAFPLFPLDGGKVAGINSLTMAVFHCQLEEGRSR